MHRIDRLFSLIGRLRMARVLLGMGCLGIITISFHLANAEQVPSGTSTLKARLSDYEATLILRPYNPSYDLGLWYGGEFTQPKQVVKSLEVRFKGKKIPFGRGIYCDLASVNSIRFKQLKGRRVVLTILGGDAADGYRAHLTFNGSDLILRRVENGEFPQNFYEETEYVNIPVKD